MRHAIVIPSIGDRSWWPLCASTFAHYCQRYGIALHVERHLPPKEEFPLPDLPDEKGARRNKPAYMSKLYFAWKYLDDYDRVAVIDDTCFVSSHAPNIFECVPYGTCGYTRTSPKTAERSFVAIRAFIEARGEDHIVYDPKLYMNSGVVVYDRTMRDMLLPSRLIHCADLLYSAYPSQAILYYLLQRRQVPMTRLSKKFNSIPGPSENRSLLNDVSPYMNNVYIHHITGGYVHRQQLLEQTGKLCLAEWGHFLSSSDTLASNA